MAINLQKKKSTKPHGAFVVQWHLIDTKLSVMEAEIQFWKTCYELNTGSLFTLTSDYYCDVYELLDYTVKHKNDPRFKELYIPIST